MSTTEPMRIRWLVDADLDAVLAIERASFGDPWQRPYFKRMIGERDVIGKVLERTAADTGHACIDSYLVYRLYKRRIELLNIAVAADCRRRGHGTVLLDYLCGKLSPDTRRVVLTHVREGNTPAHLFFRSCGFRATEVVHDYYRCGEDAYLFEYRLGSTANHFEIDEPNRAASDAG